MNDELKEPRRAASRLPFRISSRITHHASFSLDFSPLAVDTCA
jgi:hypothetical protein